MVVQTKAEPDRNIAHGCRASGGSGSAQSSPKPPGFASFGADGNADQPAPADTGIFIARDNPRRFFVRDPLPSTQSAQTNAPSQSLHESGQNGHSHGHDDEDGDQTAQPSKVTPLPPLHLRLACHPLLPGKHLGPHGQNWWSFDMQPMIVSRS